MRQKITGFVYYIQRDGSEPHLYWTQSDIMSTVDPAWIMVGPHDFEISCPADFDPRPQQVAAIDAAITKARAEMSARITELQEQKNRLLALELSA